MSLVVCHVFAVAPLAVTAQLSLKVSLVFSALSGGHLRWQSRHQESLKMQEGDWVQQEGQQVRQVPEKNPAECVEMKTPG